MKIKDLISEAGFCLNPDAPAAEARAKFRLQEMGIIPVTRGAHLEGVVHRLQAETADPSLPVSMVMNRRPLTLSGDASFEAGLDLLLAHPVDAVPVVTEDGSLLGLLTMRDVVRATGTLLAMDQPGAIAEVEVLDRPGSLKEVTSALTDTGVNILAVTVRPGTDGRKVLRFRLPPERLHDALTALKERGFSPL